MSRMPVAERREQLIEAALRVACRDGIDAATVRAVAAEAGVSLGVVHYCFLDKDELLRAVAAAITEQNVAGIGDITDATDLRSLLEAAVMNYWAGIISNRGAQLLSYELTTTSLRHSEMGRVAMDQYDGAWSALEVFLQHIEEGAGIRWKVPHRQLARTIVAVVDGFTLGWLVDGDAEAGRQGMLGFARFLESQAEAAPGASGDHAKHTGHVGHGGHGEGESARTVRHVVEHATLPA
ncbi:TetR/AcrR family transcriptional regulator [Cellulomonas sp. WB94]|uniref:TetR/AcrR family transcriptional regulator n=1 Tax=Cellulomonas sp. WB94 TaxID=2173174 RepID=UPI000D577CB4|nr:TetR family transcriptional regulator [Cellulomonas sp. WB94]PVU84179.1 TetR/AcrR family transcriptional regulator [Cellulomonas sp. WB94]